MNYHQTISLHDSNNDMAVDILDERTVDVILIFNKEEVSFGILAEDLYGLLCHLDDGGVT